MARESHPLARDPVEGGRRDERMSRRRVGVASKLVKGDEKYVHDEATSTKLCMC